MDGPVFQSWTIENFSCWNSEVHAEYIKSPVLARSFCMYMELYPRGESGLEKHLVVRFCDIKKGFAGGELSFIGPDGSVMCTVQVKMVSGESYICSPLGPKYEDVIQQIEKESVDQFTLRFVPPCKKRVKEKIYEQCMCTTVDVDIMNITLEMDKIVDSVNPDAKSQIVSFCVYRRDKAPKIYFFSVFRSERNVHLILKSYSKDGDAVFIESSIKFLKGSGTLIRIEQNKNVFREDKKSWTISDSLRYEEFLDKGNTLMLSFKIIKNDFSYRYSHALLHDQGVTVVQETNSSFPKEIYSEGLKSFTSDQTCDSVAMSKVRERDSPSKPIENSVYAVTTELMCLYQDQDFSDLRIKCGAVSFPVHRAILSARSPVFKCLLSSDMREAASGQVDVEDLDAATLARFLSFLYSGTVDDMDGENAVKLYYAADKYQVPTLKRDCVDFLLDNLSVSNVCDVLSLGDKHGDDNLGSAARDFILNNFGDVMKSEEWKSLMMSQPFLVAETMTHFAAQNYIKKSDSC